MQLRARGTVKEERNSVTLLQGPTKGVAEMRFDKAANGEIYKAETHEAPLSPLCTRRPA